MNSESIKEDIKSMMDIEVLGFFNDAIADVDGNSSCEEESTTSVSSYTYQKKITHPNQIPYIDIGKDGWDNDAIMNCLELSMNCHYHNTKDSIEMFSFHPSVDNKEKIVQEKLDNEKIPDDFIDVTLRDSQMHLIPQEEDSFSKLKNIDLATVPLPCWALNHGVSKIS